MTKKWYNWILSVEPADPAGAGEPSAQGPSAAESSAARTVADIAASLGAAPAFTASAATASSFEELYAAAEIRPPAHGYTIVKIAEMLQSEHIRSLPAGVKKSSILVALDAAGVKIQEIIEDAVRRDRALDTFENVQGKALEDLEKRTSDENRQIQEELEKIAAEHRARIQANNQEVARNKEKFYGWRLQKQQEEQRIADAVAYFVTENPITTTQTPAPPPRTKGQS